MSQRYLDDLNEEQRAAVTASIEDPLFIYAGAGSGKTRTLICRIAYMIDQGVNPENILAMTFTRKAADEIRERLKTFIGPKASSVTTSTFHQLCLNILKQNPFILGFSGNDQTFHIADNTEQRKIIKNAVNALRQKDPSRKDFSTPTSLRIYTNKMHNFVNRAKMLGKKSQDLFGDFQFILKFYEDTLHKRRLIDFTDFMTYTQELLLKHQRVAYKYRKLYQYILIDEFQDTSDINFAILKLILQQSMTRQPPNRRVTIVGDPHQSIYSFRGANPDNIKQFLEMFPDAGHVTLSKNYRSCESIVKASQSIIKFDGNETELISMIPGGNPIKFISASDAYAEADSICTEIERMVYPGSSIQYRDICIMFRMKKVASELEMELFRRNIPYSNKRGLSFFMRSEVREIVSYARLLLNFGSEENDTNQLLSSSFEMVLNVPDRQLRACIAPQVTSEASKNKVNVLKYLELLINSKIKSDFPKATIKKLAEFYQIIGKLNRQICQINTSLSTDTVLETIIEITKLCNLDENSEEKNSEDLDEFSEAVQDMINDRNETFQLLLEESKRFHIRLLAANEGTPLSSQKCLQKFIDSITLETTSSNMKNAVTLSTIHQMKGLESPVCFIMRFNQSILPMADKDSDDSGLGDQSVSLNEERRILYVAMTRARQKLFLTCALSVRGKVMEISQFLPEIDQNYITRDIILTDDEKREVQKIMKLNEEDSDSDFEFNFSQN
ncbi:UvrD/REP helicase family protein [Trichomonas vaginalis G3]|uniref:DNA 3'-5' helicase n=1 Tax=Trichomonas vaginalis (strain ATCC PRA-98 / G3) TaxID=412133 RepID=A2F783_TRIV3|nr:ATP-dependent DNA helicase SRS2 family [Trichomonas vaginalis G3]EAX99250.1 UvrD/REP helicase family protein [Trichomonas vaginalis G3]KAI5547931.1 ATP-dependent DNA helicase SRS2 family [Trichomonas vaginalis G3]|eukprot:XP_001312180.1 UvrD/REP helicase family protein [Trichomonas vaginalis G3]